jgi:hypothetical protein
VPEYRESSANFISEKGLTDFRTHSCCWIVGSTKCRSSCAVLATVALLLRSPQGAARCVVATPPQRREGLISLPFTFLSLPDVPTQVAGWDSWLSWVNDAFARWALPIMGWLVLAGVVAYGFRLASRGPAAQTIGAGPRERREASAGPDDDEPREQGIAEDRSADSPFPPSAKPLTTPAPLETGRPSLKGDLRRDTREGFDS